MFIEINFFYNGKRIKIQSTSDQIVKDIIKKFERKESLQNKNLYYIYNGNYIKDEENLAINDIMQGIDRERKKMNILAFDLINEKKENNIIQEEENESHIGINSQKSKIICPICKENIKMDIKDYKINLYECKNGHKIENILLDEFEEMQNIDLSTVKCDMCKLKDKSSIYNNLFYKCLTCKKNICPICKSFHDITHKIII